MRDTPTWDYIVVERQRLSWALLDAFALAAQQAGIPACDDFNRGDNEGVGYFEVNQKRGRRHRLTAAAAVVGYRLRSVVGTPRHRRRARTARCW